MKRLIAMLAMLTLLFGCGCSNTADEPQNNGTDNNATDNNVTDGQNNNGTVNDDNTVGDDIQDRRERCRRRMSAKRATPVKDGMDNVGDALTGDENRTDNGTAGNNADTNTNTANP